MTRTRKILNYTKNALESRGITDLKVSVSKRSIFEGDFLVQIHKDTVCGEIELAYHWITLGFSRFNSDAKKEIDSIVERVVKKNADVDDVVQLVSDIDKSHSIRPNSLSIIDNRCYIQANLHWVSIYLSTLHDLAKSVPTNLLRDVAKSVPTNLWYINDDLLKMYKEYALNMFVNELKAADRTDLPPGFNVYIMPFQSWYYDTYTPLYSIVDGLQANIDYILSELHK